MYCLVRVDVEYVCNAPAIVGMPCFPSALFSNVYLWSCIARDRRLHEHRRHHPVILGLGRRRGGFHRHREAGFPGGKSVPAPSRRCDFDVHRLIHRLHRDARSLRSFQFGSAPRKDLGLVLSLILKNTVANASHAFHRCDHRSPLPSGQPAQRAASTAAPLHGVTTTSSTL